MSLSKEVAHDLRMITTQPADLAVLPSWAKVIPWVFYIGFTFFLLEFAVNTFQSKLFAEKEKNLRGVVRQYEELMEQDKQTISRLIEQGNEAVKVARWVDYSPMLQKILIGIFSPLNDKVQIGLLQIERKQGIQPEYTINFSFKAEPGEISGVIKGVRDSLAKMGWQLTTGAQVFQDSVTNFQGYIQPIPSVMPFESQYLSVTQDPNKKLPAQPTGVSQ